VLGSRDSSVGIGTDYGLDGWRSILFSSPQRSDRFTPGKEPPVPIL
jgi:hypothetical protein